MSLSRDTRATEAALQLGLDQIPCIVAEDLNDEQIKAYRIADNKVSEAAAWDGELLRGSWNSCRLWDMIWHRRVLKNLNWIVS
ncbi:MAG: hypothetical protein ACLRZH_09195 [Ruthenibacterium lactatiformans]